jgi:beta-N-acetylhexosaminidase
MVLGPVMLDIEGLVVTSADRTLLCEPAVGGVILFSRNYASLSQLNNLVSEIRALRSPPLLIAVDYEGGRVQRFCDGFTALPAMRKIGHEYDRNLDEALLLAKTAGWLSGSELRAMDIDLSFAPCVDLDWGINDAIGDRAFHKDPEVVSDLAGAFSYGLRNAGMAPIAKHFPGHGAVADDSHKKLPIDRREYGDVLDDMRPYGKLIGNGLIIGVMLSHVVYSEIDALPASFSRYWIQSELRSRLGFSGAVFCDDLNMKATASYGTMPTRAKLALEAGCDMVLICNNRPAAKAVVMSLKEYTNPLSLVRLARLHGSGQILRESLLVSEEWQSAAKRFIDWQNRSSLELNN